MKTAVHRQSPNQAYSASDSRKAAAATSSEGLLDNRSSSASLRQLIQMANDSPRSQLSMTLSHELNPNSTVPYQRMEVDISSDSAVDTDEANVAAPKINNTGLPNQLKRGIEALSGMSMDHVRVHYNSPQPAQLHAYAFAQGSNIHVGSGQERHLAHEAWHVVQQAQGRVKPTFQAKDVSINNESALEKEADVMGDRAYQFKFSGAASALALGVMPRVGGSQSIRQFALPGTYEEANADSYAPQGKTESYAAGVKNFDRLACAGFAPSWRELMMNIWESEGLATKPDLHGIRKVLEPVKRKFVDERGIQLDHATSVSTMKDNLLDVDSIDAINAAYSNVTMKNYYHMEGKQYQHVPWPASRNLAVKKFNSDKFIDVVPTIHAARKYYHDVDNLQPMAATDNAAKGDKDADIEDYDKNDLDVRREWEDMTTWLNNAVAEKDIDEVDYAVNAMNETLEDYDGEWPNS